MIEDIAEIWAGNEVVLSINPGVNNILNLKSSVFDKRLIMLV